MHILISNDDGIQAPGIKALERAARRVADHVSIVAPVAQHSAQSHAITIRHPILVDELERSPEQVRIAVEGTPTDCVRLAILELCPKPIDLVLGGINHGANMGWEIFFSGTVSIAAEAYSFGIPAVAFSQASWHDHPMDACEEAAVKVLERVLEEDRSVPFLYNVNIPAIPYADIKGVRVTSLEPNVKGDAYICREAPDGRKYYWATWGERFTRRQELTDSNLDAVAVREGYVSLTKLHYEVSADPATFALRERYEGIRLR